jgi:hypothetical protein
VASTCSRQSDIDLTSLGGIDLLEAVGFSLSIGWYWLVGLEVFVGFELFVGLFVCWCNVLPKM